MKTENIKKILRREAKKFLEYPNINSVGIGYKEVNGKKKPVIQFTVDVKANPEVLDKLGTVQIPKFFSLQGETVETDVVQRKFQPAYRVNNEVLTKDPRKQRQDPLMPGISVGHVKITAGTIGCIVYGQEDEKPYLLSNWHVLHGYEGKIGDPIVQPGVYDDNNIQGNTVGNLERSHLGLAGDCAIASLKGRGISPQIFGLEVMPEQLAEVELGDKVVKSGRTTAITYGEVRRIEVMANIDYGAGEVTIGGFEIGPDPDYPARDNEISMGGDSGSCWLIRDKDGKTLPILAGLHFAGEAGFVADEYALACNIVPVFKKLEIKLNKSYLS